MANPQQLLYGPADSHHHAGDHHAGDHHAGDHHTHQHERLENCGSYWNRDPSKGRQDWTTRAFTIGIGGPVGSGKTALVLQLCRLLREKYKVVVVTNDIFTKEDYEFLVQAKALPANQISGIETGGCPHAAIREDFTANLEEAKYLTQQHKADFVFIESGGDNLAANFSRELADYIIYVIDVAGGDKVPRKGGPGITQCDLLVINKSDLAQAVGASVELMVSNAVAMRQGGQIVVTQAKFGMNVNAVSCAIEAAFAKCRTE